MPTLSFVDRQAFGRYVDVTLLEDGIDLGRPQSPRNHTASTREAQLETELRRRSAEFDRWRGRDEIRQMADEVELDEVNIGRVLTQLVWGDPETSGDYAEATTAGQHRAEPRVATTGTPGGGDDGDNGSFLSRLVVALAFLRDILKRALAWVWDKFKRFCSWCKDMLMSLFD